MDCFCRKPLNKGSVIAMASGDCKLLGCFTSAEVAPFWKICVKMCQSILPPLAEIDSILGIQRSALSATLRSKVVGRTSKSAASGRSDVWKKRHKTEIVVSPVSEIMSYSLTIFSDTGTMIFTGSKSFETLTH